MRMSETDVYGRPEMSKRRYLVGLGCSLCTGKGGCAGSHTENSGVDFESVLYQIHECLWQTSEIPVLFGGGALDGNGGCIRGNHQGPRCCPKQYYENRRGLQDHQEKRGEPENGISVFGIVGQTKEFRKVAETDGNVGTNGFPTAT